MGGDSFFRTTDSTLPQEDGKHRLFAACSPISDEAISSQEILPIALSTMTESTEDISYIKGKDQ